MDLDRTAAPSPEGELLARLARAVGPGVVDEAASALARLAARSGERPLAEHRLLVAFGGGKDSAWTLAFVRLMQLLLRKEAGATFDLDVLLMVHPGVPLGVFVNIRNVFTALGVAGNPDVRVRTVTLGGEPIALEFGSIPADRAALFRQEILVSGHLSQGNGRETFCNGCNFTLMSAIARYVISQEGRLDYIVTGDSPDEILSYWRWVQKAAAGFGLERIPKRLSSWGSLFSKLSEIGNAYYGDLLGGGATTSDSPHWFPSVQASGLRLPEYFGVFGDTRYEYAAHDAFLTEFLGFVLRDDAFNFTESDCRNPALMAHLRGLLADFEGRGYQAGVREYVDFVTGLMVRKSYTPEMIERAVAPYRTPASVEGRRRAMEEYAAAQLGLEPSHLAGMVGSPLTDSLARLDDFLRWTGEDQRSTSELRSYLEAAADTASRPDGAPLGERALALEQRLAKGRRGDRLALVQGRAFVRSTLGLAPENALMLLTRRTVSRDAAAECGTEALRVVRRFDPHQARLPSATEGAANSTITGR